MLIDRFQKKQEQVRQAEEAGKEAEEKENTGKL